jgi:GNAT superfamily N-acetyltransferase
MVLVARDQRRRGLGTDLLRRAIEAVRARGAAAGLDATEFGRPVYLPLGFRDRFSVSRWRGGTVTRPEHPPGGYRIRPVNAKDLEAIIAFDEPLSAMRRGEILRYLFASAPDLAFIAEHENRIAGYALGRPGRTAMQIGPIVADDDAVAVSLAGHGLATAGLGALLDVPDRHRALTAGSPRVAPNASAVSCACFWATLTRGSPILARFTRSPARNSDKSALEPHANGVLHAERRPALVEPAH